MWLNCKTEFSFKQVYGHIDKVAERCAALGTYGGIADLGNTFGHIRWNKACKKVGIKPIFGVQLPVVDELQKGERRYPYNWMTFIALSTEGLQEIYELVNKSYEQFYYRPRISYKQVNDLSKNITIFSGVAPRHDLLTIDIFIEIGPHTKRTNSFFQSIATIDNYYPLPEDKKIYEPFADERLRERHTYPMHILSEVEWIVECDNKIALDNLKLISEAANAELPKASMVHYIGSDKIEEWCHKGACKKEIDLRQLPYSARYIKEINLIKEKDYADYFLMVADAIRYAKERMCVGPSRGSSAGSLVCYLMGITEIDPLEYDLYFERFIDVNRFDLPDIDIDFQKNKRHLVIKYLEKKYGKENVAQIGNINRLKPKSAIDRFAKAMYINVEDVQEVKDAIMERSGGDARADQCMEDTLNDTDIGKSFLETYPNMSVVTKIEAHASHTGIHAAGILVCNEPITKYAGIFIDRAEKRRIGMLDKKDAEAINLLKIDALGLRTLDIIADVCDQIGKPYDWIYSIPTDDELTYKIFNDNRFNGIFQFEGPAVRGLAGQMPIENMEDIAALGALGRPGPLMSGGANTFIKYRTGKEKIQYLSEHQSVVDATKGTYGVIIYQEQMLAIGRNYGKLSWEDTSELRKAASKSLGDEFFDKYKKNFIKGAIENGETKEQAEVVWKAMHTFGSWSFNKSHAVSYGLISYLCAYLKAHYPLEFVVGCLNHTKNDISALKILRDSVENDGVKYKFFDIHMSTEKWSVTDGILYGGFTTLHNIGPAKAKKIIKARSEREQLSPGLKKAVVDPVSPFKYLYPGKELYGDYYTDPNSHNLNGSVSLIKNTKNDGSYNIIGCLVKKNLRDANEACFVSKRGGEHVIGDTAWLNITVEDDTDSIMCKIQIKDYNRLGKEIAETGKEDKDWYLIHGSKINGWNLLFVKNIKKITRSI